LRRSSALRVYVSAALLSALLLGITSPPVAQAQGYQQLVSFGSTVADFPGGPACLASDGGLYGLTLQGGASHAGSVFVLRRDPGGDWVATTVHSFTGTDGRAPRGGVVQARDGQLYGTTSAGGQGERGTVFRMTQQGALTTLHSFTGPDGAAPSAHLVQGPDDALYGTTSEGGANGLGTVFRITPGGDFTNLNSFAGVPGQMRPPLTLATDGNFYGVAGNGVFRMTADGTMTTIGFSPDVWPTTGLVQGSDGDLYGLGDIDPLGSLTGAFKMSTSGAYTLLHVFSLQGEPGRGNGELVQAPDGTFYGASSYGGTGPNYGEGTLFRMTPGGEVALLHDFSGPDGSLPSGGLTLGPAGLLYGITSSGGAQGGGTVFEATSTGMVTTLHAFASSQGGLFAWGDLLRADDGNFYGTTYGSPGPFAAPSNAYRMTPEGEVTTLHAFTGAQGAGTNPRAGLAQGTDGDFYGTTVWGGSATNSGTVFKVSPSGEFTTLHVFNGGGLPTAPLVQASDGSFYGTTLWGGRVNCGTVFKITAAGELTTLHEFTVYSPEFGLDGCLPYSGLVEATDGNLYGTTVGKGTSEWLFRGTIYRITPDGQFQSVLFFREEYVAGGLVQGSDGRLYGTTYGSPPFPGWASSSQERVFAMGLDGSLTTLHVFSGDDGRAPRATLVEVGGFFYGSTTRGGLHGFGTLFRVSPSGEFETLHHFTGTDGSLPVGRLASAPDGSLYGTTVEGGISGRGVAFRIVP
jgi:uncharacterized repeat protein (TIGR03803 family)